MKNTLIVDKVKESVLKEITEKQKAGKSLSEILEESRGFTITNTYYNYLVNSNKITKKMNTHNYPTWLVPLEIAQELKEIGYKEDCYFEFSKDDGLTIETLERESCIIGIDELLSCTNEYWQNVSVPTFEQALAWFRERGYKITFKDINIGTQCAFYHLDINEGHTFSHFAKKYEKAREGLVMKLIEVHKEFGNNIKRK